MTPPLIAQLSDPHIRLDDQVTHRALTAAVDRILALRPRPLAVILTGDIANSGDPEEHALADTLLARLELPVHRVAGNHDLLPDRTEFAVDAGGIRIVGCDTSVDGRDDGALDVDGLAARLDEDRETPTIVAMHHPPFDIGLPWLDEIGLPRADRDGLAALLRRSPQVKRVVAGHVHRAIATTVGGVGAVTCASTNIEAALDFETREMALITEPPSILVHALLDGEIVTHVQPVQLGSAVMRLRLAELIAALSLATDLGLGLPQEHVLRQCRIALGLAERVGVDEAERAAIYYVAMLAWVGCTADSYELSAQFGDEIAFRADASHIDLAGLPLMGLMLRRAGDGRGPLRRAQVAATLVATGGRAAAEAMTAHCRVASAIAARLGLGPDVQQPLLHVFSRWDGKGLPKGAAGEELPLAIRLVQLAAIAEVHHRAAGVESAIAVSRERSGGQFDPRLAAAFADCAHELLDGLEEESSWDAVIAAEPVLDKPLASDEIDNALEAVADFSDLKSPWFSGHSRGVASLAAGAAQRAGLSADAVTQLRRAGLVHDLGRSGVPNSIWDKPGPLSSAERERVRLHPYYTDRVLARPEALAGLGAIAVCHHERLDASGYHRSLPGSALSPAARILAAADVYHALTEERPHRLARKPEVAAAELRGEVRAGRIDADAAEDVLAAAGHARATARERARPGGLTARELEVLLLVARGASSRDVARRLVIADKTARNHVERIYTKLGVSTRAEASLYAMRHGLVD